MGVSWLCLADYGTTTGSRQTFIINSARLLLDIKSVVLGSNSLVIARGGRVADCWLLQDPLGPKKDWD